MYDLLTQVLLTTSPVMVSGLVKLKALEKLGYVEIGDDDIAHLIAHFSKVPLAMQDGKTKYFLNYVLHVPNITKNLVSVG